MTTKTDEWRKLSLTIGSHDITLIQDRFLEACDEIEQLEARLAIALAVVDAAQIRHEGERGNPLAVALEAWHAAKEAKS